MGFVPFDNGAQIEMRFLQDGQAVENVYHVNQFGPFSVEDLSDVASVFKVWWDEAMQPFTANNVTLREIVARGMESQTDPAISYVTGLPLTGTNASPGLPNHVTCAVKWTTALAGRSYRGRTYHIGLTENQVNGNTLDATFATDIRGNYADLIARLATAGYTLDVASRVSNGSERAAGVLSPILAAVLDPTVDSQRRRLPGRGS